jgi:hypothetical protein
MENPKSNYLTRREFVRYIHPDQTSDSVSKKYLDELLKYVNDACDLLEKGRDHWGRDNDALVFAFVKNGEAIISKVDDRVVRFNPGSPKQFLIKLTKFIENDGRFNVKSPQPEPKREKTKEPTKKKAEKKPLTPEEVLRKFKDKEKQKESSRQGDEYIFNLLKFNNIVREFEISIGVLPASKIDLNNIRLSITNFYRKIEKSEKKYWIGGKVFVENDINGDYKIFFMPAPYRPSFFGSLWDKIRGNESEPPKLVSIHVKSDFNTQKEKVFRSSGEELKKFNNLFELLMIQLNIQVVTDPELNDDIILKSRLVIVKTLNKYLGDKRYGRARKEKISNSQIFILGNFEGTIAKVMKNGKKVIDIKP